MAKIVKTFEKYTKQHKLQVLEIVANANSVEEAENLSYDDFQINLYINHEFVADISPVLAKSEAYQAMIDETNWVELYKEQKEEVYA